MSVFRSRPLYSVKVDVTDDATIMHVRGDMDIETTLRFESSVHRVVAQHRPSVLITDLFDVAFLSAAGLAALVRCNEMFESAGRFLVVALTAVTIRPMKITGLTDVFDIYPSIYAALATV
ncbi:anti-sigma factor antagonist [Rhodococcus hoagii]|nr:anti-sigma factor antagonist [Prescottella equi]